MDTKKIRTRQEFKFKDPTPKGTDFIIGLDIGYSAVKVFFESGHICFPSFIHRLPNGVTAPDKDDILYRDDETGEIWMVGLHAQDMVSASETNDTDAELFSRKRYGRPQFRVLCNTALGLIAANKEKNGDYRKIVIQTGLPAAYIRADSKALKKAMANNRPFSISVGGQEWIPCQFNIKEDDVSIMPQPLGGLYSTIMRNDGTLVHSSNPNEPDAKRILSGNTLVMDIGFGTFDFYGTIERNLVCTESIDYISMREILKKTTEKILDETNADIRVAAIQKYLGQGTFTTTDIDEETQSPQRVTHDIAPYVEESNKEVLNAMKTKVLSVTNSLQGYDYLIIDGGTGAAWFQDFKDWLANFDIRIFASDHNDSYGMIYSNARGYYMYKYMESRRKKS